MCFIFDGEADRVNGMEFKGSVLDGDHTLYHWGRKLMEQKMPTNN